MLPLGAPLSLKTVACVSGMRQRNRNPQKEFIDNKGETIHIYNKNDGYESIG